MRICETNLVWLGFKIHPNGIIPTNKKCESIVNLDTPKTLKQLRSFMGCIHHLIKFTPNLATLSEPLRPLLSKSNLKSQNKLDWKTLSTNELELLAVVWALEHFKYYLYGSHFTLQTDHQTLLSALKENRGNKTYQSRLTRWVDRLLPFPFSVERIPGKNMGFADYLSRNPSSDAPTPSDKDKNFVINTIE